MAGSDTRRALWGRLVARLVGARYGGVLSELARPGRDGATRCPRCDDEGFEPLWLDRDYVRSVGCGTVYRRVPRRPVAVALRSRAMLRDVQRGGTDRQTPPRRPWPPR